MPILLVFSFLMALLSSEPVSIFFANAPVMFVDNYHRGNYLSLIQPIPNLHDLGWGDRTSSAYQQVANSFSISTRITVGPPSRSIVMSMPLVPMIGMMRHLRTRSTGADVSKDMLTPVRATGLGKKGTAVILVGRAM